jgi:hypothetical protein
MSRCKPALVTMILMGTIAWASASHVVEPGTAPLGARASESKIHAPYPDSAQGLKQQLKDMRELARRRKLDQLREMITNLEFPDARAWYLANFGTPGLQTADYYENNLKKAQEQLENELIEFARQVGYFSVKKQNAKKVYPTLVTAPEVFLASWGKSSVYLEHPDETPVGYFFFVDGKFRWDNTIMWVEVD